MAADPVSAQKPEQMAYDDGMAISLYCGATIWAVTINVRDTWLGTRGKAAGWKPQNAWSSK